MHYSCRNKSNRSERPILKVTDGYQAQVSESICFSLETAVGLTAEYAEYAERRGRQNEVLKVPSVRLRIHSSQGVLLPRVPRIPRFICSFWLLNFKFQISNLKFYQNSRTAAFPYFIIGNSLFDIGYSDRNLPLHIGCSCLPAIMRIAVDFLPLHSLCSLNRLEKREFLS